MFISLALKYSSVMYYDRVTNITEASKHIHIYRDPPQQANRQGVQHFWGSLANLFSFSLNQVALKYIPVSISCRLCGVVRSVFSMPMETSSIFAALICELRGRHSTEFKRRFETWDRSGEVKREKKPCLLYVDPNKHFESSSQMGDSLTTPYQSWTCHFSAHSHLFLEETELQSRRLWHEIKQILSTINKTDKCSRIWKYSILIMDSSREILLWRSCCY